MPQPGRRRLPFLHRNWTVGITASQKWSPKRRQPASSEAVPHGKHDEDPHVHPAKRRRVGPISLPIGSLEDIIKLPEYPGDRANGLRVQIFNVFNQDTPRLRFASSLAATNPSDVTRYNARFKVTIVSEKCGMPLVMYCAAQIGSVQAYKAVQGSYGLAKLVLEPFTIPLEQIAILHRDSDVFGLADTYKLRVEIESTASNEAWPPLDLLSLADANRRGSDYRPKRAGDCILYAESSDFFGRPRMRIPLWLRESPQHDPVPTNFVMDMDVRWTTGFLERPRKNVNLGVLPTIVALHPDEPLPLPTLDLRDLWPERHSFSTRGQPATTSRKTHANGTTRINGNGHIRSQINNQISRELNGQTNGHDPETSVIAEDVDSAAEDDNDNENDEPEGLRTPSRSLRARRRQPDYNVRTIINKVHKINERVPRKRMLGNGSKVFTGLNGFTGLYKFNSDTQNIANHNVKVSYSYHQDHVTLDGFVCCMCMASSPDVNQLRAHFLAHLHYTFHYEHRLGVRGGGHMFRISHIDDDSDSNAGDKYQTTVYQLGRPTKALDLEKFLNGDNSWVSSRFGPENDDKVVQFTQTPRVKSKPAPQKKEVLVPNTRQPLYDPLSKALLKPGSVLRTNVVDDSWRIHKHREIVQDYTDLTLAEKEFIQEWDRFVILKRIASDAYIPRTMVQFIEERGPWLVAELPRAMEFGKLMAVMVAHDILTDDDIDAVTHAMDAAWAALRKQAAASSSSPPSPTQGSAAPKPYTLRWSANSCPVCGFCCVGADAIICRNKDCNRRQYHLTCLGKTKVDPEQREDWYCNNCAHLADPAHLVKPPDATT